MAVLDIDSIVQQNNDKVYFFSRPGCIYCDKLSNELQICNIPYEIITIEKENTESTTQLVERTSHKTFPQLFIGQEFIGGYDAFIKLIISRKLVDKLEPLGIHIDLDDF